MSELNSIWIHQRPASAENVLGVVSDLWPSGGRSKGAGGKAFRLVGAPAAFSTAELQQFVNGLAAELRYQTFELFLAPPVESDASPGTAVLVGGAYRKTDAYGDVTNGKSLLKRGVYPLSHQLVEPLRFLLSAGEQVAQIRTRLETYHRRSAGSQDERDAMEYIDYVAAGSALATLAGLGPSSTDGPGPVLWSIAREVLGTASEVPKEVRCALRLLHRSTGHVDRTTDELKSPRLFLEEDDDLSAIKLRAEAYAADRRTQDAPHPTSVHFDQAIDIWTNFSRNIEAVGRVVGSRAWWLPSSAVHLLFEAQVRSYPIWLQSATLRVEAQQTLTLHGDLRARVALQRGRHNKVVNVVSLLAYEQAVERLLKPTAEWKRDLGHPGRLHSMLLVPFETVSACGRWVGRGFVRFMNRFHRVGTVLALYDYELKGSGADWLITAEEKNLGRAIRDVLEEQIPKLGFFPPPSRTLAPSKASDAAVDSSANVWVAPRTPVDGGDAAEGHLGTHTMLARAPAMKPLLEQIEKFGRAGVPVVVQGETGTGKELVARALHKASSRANGPFIAVNCGALVTSLLEDDLFGHVPGSYSGAIRERAGCFERAHGGTLFLDEVSELNGKGQAALLRVLQEGVVQRIGGTKDIRVEVQVIAATNRDLWDEVTSGRFRDDLFFRLSIGRIVIPPLRHRTEDIPEIAAHFVAKIAQRSGLRPPSMSREFLAALVAYSWPGNVRELQGALERAMALSGGEALTLEHLSVEMPRYEPRGRFSDERPVQ